MSFFKALVRYAGSWIYSAVITVIASFRRQPQQECDHPDAGEDGP